jgi:hypothetical protein
LNGVDNGDGHEVVTKSVSVNVELNERRAEGIDVLDLSMGRKEVNTEKGKRGRKRKKEEQRHTFSSATYSP